MADETAVFAEPLAAAFEILEQVHVTPDMRCTVLGDGKLGLLVAQVLRRAGARVRAVGRHDEKLAMLRRTTSRRCWLATSSRKAEAADLVVEATGTARGLEPAIAATRPRGTLVLKSTVAEQVRRRPLAAGHPRDPAAGLALRALRPGPARPRHAGDRSRAPVDGPRARWRAPTRPCGSRTRPVP